MHKRESEKKIPSLRENELGCEHQKIDRDKVVENDAAKQKQRKEKTTPLMKLFMYHDTQFQHPKKQNKRLCSKRGGGGQTSKKKKKKKQHVEII